MKNLPLVLQLKYLQLFIFFSITFFACNNNPGSNTKETTFDSVAANIKMYTAVWDEIKDKVH